MQNPFYFCRLYMCCTAPGAILEHIHGATFRDMENHVPEKQLFQVSTFLREGIWVKLQKPGPSADRS